MTLDRGLTETPLEPGSAAGDLREQLARHGLELWHAPEGFWAIRLKGQATAPPRRARRRRTR